MPPKLKLFHDLSNGKNRVPIHGMTLRNLPDIAAVLLNGGADPNTLDGEGWAPLHMAAFIGSRRMMEVLMENFADPVVRGPDGCTAAHLAAENGAPELLDWLVQNGADISVKDDFGRTPLWYAAYFGRMNAVLFLVEKSGVAVNETCNVGCTALHVAALNGHQKVCMYLVSKGAALHLRNYAGLRPLEAACIGGSLDTVRFLMEAAELPMIPDGDEMSGFPRSSAAASRAWNAMSFNIRRIGSTEQLQKPEKEGSATVASHAGPAPIANPQHAQHDSRSLTHPNSADLEACTPRPGSLALALSGAIKDARSRRTSERRSNLSNVYAEAQAAPPAPPAAPAPAEEGAGPPGSGEGEETISRVRSRNNNAPSPLPGIPEPQSARPEQSSDGGDMALTTITAEDVDSAAFLPKLGLGLRPPANRDPSRRGLSSLGTATRGSAAEDAAQNAAAAGLSIRIARTASGREMMKKATGGGANDTGVLDGSAAGFGLLDSLPLTGLHLAAAHGHFDIVVHMVEVAKVPINEARGDGVTALHLAVAAENRAALVAGVDESIRVPPQGGQQAGGGGDGAAGSLETTKSLGNTRGGGGAGTTGVTRQPSVASMNGSNPTVEASKRSVAGMNGGPPTGQGSTAGLLDLFYRRDLAWWLPATTSGMQGGSPTAAAGLQSSDSARARGSAAPGLGRGQLPAQLPWNFPLLPPKLCTSHLKVVRYLMDRGADPWCKTTSRALQPFHVVADHLRTSFLEEIMRRQPEDVIRARMAEMPDGDFVLGVIVESGGSVLAPREFGRSKRRTRLVTGEEPMGGTSTAPRPGEAGMRGSAFTGSDMFRSNTAGFVGISGAGKLQRPSLDVPAARQTSSNGVDRGPSRLVPGPGPVDMRRQGDGPSDAGDAWSADGGARTQGVAYSNIGGNALGRLTEEGGPLSDQGEADRAIHNQVQGAAFGSEVPQTAASAAPTGLSRAPSGPSMGVNAGQVGGGSVWDAGAWAGAAAAAPPSIFPTKSGNTSQPHSNNSALNFGGPLTPLATGARPPGPDTPASAAPTSGTAWPRESVDRSPATGMAATNGGGWAAGAVVLTAGGVATGPGTVRNTGTGAYPEAGVTTGPLAGMSLAEIERTLTEATEQADHFRREAYFYKTQCEILQVKRMFLEDTNGRLESDRSKLLAELSQTKEELAVTRLTLEKSQAGTGGGKPKWGIGRNKVAQASMTGPQASGLRAVAVGGSVAMDSGQPGSSMATAGQFGSQPLNQLLASQADDRKQSHVMRPAGQPNESGGAPNPSPKDPSLAAIMRSVGQAGPLGSAGRATTDTPTPLGKAGGADVRMSGLPQASSQGRGNSRQPEGASAATPQAQPASTPAAPGKDKADGKDSRKDGGGRCTIM